MLDRLDDPTPFYPDEQFRSRVERRARTIRFRRRLLTTSMVSVIVIAGLAVSALAYVARRDAALERIPIATQPSTDGATNLLVVGSNDLPTTGTDHLADEVAILRFETDGSVRVLSIPRDLWDPQTNRPLIADYLDGPQALVDRVTGLLGVPVDHYVGLDFAGFAALVDEAGGLHVGIDQPLQDDATGIDLQPTPCTTLDGATTLALVRSRTIGAPAGDLGRIELDQAIMKIAVASIADSNTDLLTIDEYTRTLADHAVVDSGLSLTRLMRLGRALVAAGSAGTSAVTLPVEEMAAPDGGGTVLRTNSAAPAVLQSFGAAASNSPSPSGPAPSVPDDAGPIHPCLRATFSNGWRTAVPRAPRIRLVGLCLFVATLAIAHASLYAWTTPPWHLFDEEQHVDYSLSLRDRRLPEIDDDIHQGIIDDAVATHRWATFGLPQPRSTRVEELGLEGRSYEAYQPPLYYAIGAVAILPAGHDAARALWWMRALSVVFAGLVAALVVVVTWEAIGAPAHPSWFVAAGGAFVALLPSFAQAGGRASNDIAVAAAIVATAACALAWARVGTSRLALLTGACAAAACLTKSSGLIALAIVALVAVRRRPSWPAAVAVALPIAAVVAWALLTWTRYGVFEGSRAFIDDAHFAPRPWTLLARSARPSVLGTTLLMESQRNGANAWTLAIVGLVVPLAAVGSRHARRLASEMVALIVVVCIGVTVVAFAEGLEVGVMSRLVLAAVAAVAALVGAGANRRALRTPAVALVVITAAMAWWYHAHL